MTIIQNDIIFAYSFVEMYFRSTFRANILYIPGISNLWKLWASWHVLSISMVDPQTSSRYARVIGWAKGKSVSLRLWSEGFGLASLVGKAGHYSSLPRVGSWWLVGRVVEMFGLDLCVLVIFGHTTMGLANPARPELERRNNGRR